MSLAPTSLTLCGYTRPMPPPAAPAARIRPALPPATLTLPARILGALQPSPPQPAATLPMILEFQLAILLGTTAALLALGAPDFRTETIIIGLCVIGSIVGGFLGVAWKPGSTPRQNYFLFGTNLAIGTIFAPLTVLVLAPRLAAGGIQIGPIACIAIGGAVSAFGVMLIQPIIPLLLTALEKRAQRLADQITPAPRPPRRRPPKVDP
jgi:hypothetical protein